MFNLLHGIAQAAQVIQWHAAVVFRFREVDELFTRSHFTAGGFLLSYPCRERLAAGHLNLARAAQVILFQQPVDLVEIVLIHRRNGFLIRERRKALDDFFRLDTSGARFHVEVVVEELAIFVECCRLIVTLRYRLASLLSRLQFSAGVLRRLAKVADFHLPDDTAGCFTHCFRINASVRLIHLRAACAVIGTGELRHLASLLRHQALKARLSNRSLRFVALRIECALLSHAALSHLPHVHAHAAQHFQFHRQRIAALLVMNGLDSLSFD